MANIDIEMSEFTKKTTLANDDFIVGTLSDGKSVQIKVSDLASVVAGILGNPLGYKGLLTSSDDANNLNDGIYNVVNGDYPSNMMALNSILFQFTHKYRTDCYQILFEANDTNIKARMKKFDNWTSWKVLFNFE